MSQTIATTVSRSPIPSREISPTTAPIAVLQNPIAQALSNIFPLLPAAYFYIRFAALVVNPVSTLAIDLLPVALIQGVYAVVTLPVSKRATPTDQLKPNTPSKAKVAKSKTTKAQSANEIDLGTRISNALLALFLALVATLPVFILLVLFGAPLTTHHAQTLLTAAHFSLLAVFPLFYTHGVDRQAWWEIGGAMLPADGVWGSTIGTALGAWLGAVPIPLDWDREWQKWPVTIVAGMYAGALIGSFAGRYLLYGKRLQFRPDNEEDKHFAKKME